MSMVAWAPSWLNHQSMKSLAVAGCGAFFTTLVAMMVVATPSLGRIIAIGAPAGFICTYCEVPAMPMILISPLTHFSNCWAVPARATGFWAASLSHQLSPYSLAIMAYWLYCRPEAES